MKRFLFAIAIIAVIGAGGLFYRNITERSYQPIACPLDVKVCPDGTSVARTGLSCTFPACPAPNVSLPDVGIAYAIPAGFQEAEVTDPAAVAAYDIYSASSSPASIVIRRYLLASSTALAVIRQTAVRGVSGEPVSSTAFSSTQLGARRFTVVSVERFEGVIDTAFYLARTSDILRFDAIDRGADDWTNPNLDISALPAHASLRRLLETLQSQ